MSRCNCLLVVFVLVSVMIIGVRSMASEADAPPQPELVSNESQTTQATVRLSSRFINHVIQRDVNKWQYFQDVMFGTSTSGPASMHGRISAELIPSTDQAVVDIRLLGSTRSDDNVGQRRSITIYSAAGAQIDARKRLLLDATGIQALPSTADCVAQVDVKEIVARRRFVERLAWRRMDRMHGQIQELAADKVRTRTQQELDNEMTVALAEAEKFLQDQQGVTFTRHEEFPCRLKLGSTAEFLQAAIVPFGKTEEASVNPVELNARHDVGLALHQACFNRICQFGLSGKQLEDTMFLDAMEFLTGNSPRQLWVHDRAERWSVVMAKELPATAIFENDRYTITMRTEQVTRGNTQLNRPLEIVAIYTSEITEDGPHLIRQGDLAIQFAESANANEQEEELRRFLHRKLSGVFQSDIYFDGLVPPVGGSLSKLRQLELSELTSRDGWAVMGYQLPPANPQIAHVDQ